VGNFREQNWGFSESAVKDRPVRLEPLAEDFQAELIQAEARGQAWADEATAGTSRSSGWAV